MTRSDLVRNLEKYAKVKDWGFDYGTRAFLNINDLPTQTQDEYEIGEIRKYLFLLPVIRRLTRDERLNTVSTLEFDISGYLFVKSDIDEEYYPHKFQNHIEPLELCFDTFLDAFFTCNDINVIAEQTSEIVNDLDTGTDGLFFEITAKFL